MKIKILLILLSTLSLTKPILSAEAADKEAATDTSCVILLHGLLRSSYSMYYIENSLAKNGYKVWNVSYPSTEKTVGELANIAIKPALEFCEQQNSTKINFVTHSLGGILVREFLQDNKIKNLNKIVMLSPPNHGTELVDLLRSKEIFKSVFGPAGQQLGTDDESITKTLKPIAGEIGIIVGNFSPNPWASWIIPGEDDGIVSVEGGRLPEMQDFLILDYSHTLIMLKADVINQILLFLTTGKFSHTKDFVGVKAKSHNIFNK